MRKIFLTVVIATPLLLSACNTIAGIGKDVGAAGNAVASEAEKAKGDKAQ